MQRFLTRTFPSPPPPLPPPANGDKGGAEKKKYPVNLPKTAFAMKANLVQNEPASLKRWEGPSLYAKLREPAQGQATFVFHDGPPYANGSIHLGHLLNKCAEGLRRAVAADDGLDVPVRPRLGLPRAADRAQGDDRTGRGGQVRQARRRWTADHAADGGPARVPEVRREVREAPGGADAAAADARGLRAPVPDDGAGLRGRGAGGVRGARRAGARLPRSSSRCTGRSPTRPRWPRRSWSTTTARTSRCTWTSRPRMPTRCTARSG